MITLHRQLEVLYARTDGTARIAADPIAFVHRYARPEDQEIAGLIAVSLAYGRVSLFFPPLHQLFAAMDDRGGPEAFVRAFEPDHAAPFADLIYRFNRGSDFTVLFGALRRVLTRHGSLEALFVGTSPLQQRLTDAVHTLRAHVVDEARAQGAGVTSFDDLSRGLKYLLPSPDTGSACKRWNLYLRWMVRPPTEGVDLGIWTALTPADLVMPVDVHISRQARFVGLTTRSDASWRTAVQITDRLRAFDPTDPVRFDFALCHLGISQGCLGHRSSEVCPSCPLDRLCGASES